MSNVEEKAGEAAAPTIARLHLGLAAIAFATLLLELALIRVFDVILTPTMGYAVITAAIFALGLGGIYLYLVPVSRATAWRLLPWLYVLFALSAALLLPVMNALPFDLDLRRGGVAWQALAWLAMYGALITPFFVSGLIITLILTHRSERVNSLYFADLLGAGIGAALVVPLITPLGAAGVQMIAASSALLGAALLARRLPARVAWLALALAADAGIIAFGSELEYHQHTRKREVTDWREQGKREWLGWDPVSLVEVFPLGNRSKYFALDGGQQASNMNPLGDTLDKLQEEARKHPGRAYHGRGSLVHFLKRDTGAHVLIIGAAVGSETASSLIFGAERVVSIDLVGEMVRAAKGRYAESNGNVFNDPRVDYRVGEGRTYLRGTDERFDIIQMQSNHTSSSIADGSGAGGIAYLQTVEAYMEYFTHLRDDGILQIAHHLYPRMLTTAAEAWRRLGRGDFARHALVFEYWRPDTLPVMLIRMRPWTASEVGEASDFLGNHGGVTLHSLHHLRPDARPSSPVLKNHPYEAMIRARHSAIDQLGIWVGTYHQGSLPYDVTLEIENLQGERLAGATLPGREIRDNRPMVFSFPPLRNRIAEKLRVRLLTPNTVREHAFSVFEVHGRPVAFDKDEPKSFLIAFDPRIPRDNLIPAEFLDGPFPGDLAARASHDLTPVTDDKPYFGMIRKSFGHADWVRDEFMDLGTERFLNVQLYRFLSAEYLHLFIVAAAALVFSGVFLFVPLFASRHGRARWPGMGWYLLYFSCLGLGFILIEIVAIQVFRKLIGFPTHNFTTVITALLISAGLGSLATTRLGADRAWRWPLVFVAVVLYGALIALFAQQVFEPLLAQPLAVRILATAALLFPLGFALGMPLPLGIQRLGRVAPQGIPWAWGMNGFFTVIGGFLGLLWSIEFGFRSAIFIGLTAYVVAMLAYARLRTSSPVVG